MVFSVLFVGEREEIPHPLSPISIDRHRVTEMLIRENAKLLK